MKRYRSLLIIIFIVFLTTFVWDQIAHRDWSSPQVDAQTTPVVQKPTLNEDQLFDLVNQWREKNGYVTYKTSDFLCDIAKTRLTEIKINFSHEGFGVKRFCGDNACTLSENLAEGYLTENRTLNAWFESPSHLQNLEKKYTHSCIKTSGDYAVQIFGYY